jgi:hypothetical protein
MILKIWYLQKKKNIGSKAKERKGKLHALLAYNTTWKKSKKDDKTVSLEM